MTLAILILWLPDAGGTPAVPANHLTGRNHFMFKPVRWSALRFDHREGALPACVPEGGVSYSSRTLPGCYLQPVK
jgi:hypothetical protein